MQCLTARRCLAILHIMEYVRAGHKMTLNKDPFIFDLQILERVALGGKVMKILLLISPLIS